MSCYLFQAYIYVLLTEVLSLQMLDFIPLQSTKPSALHLLLQNQLMGHCSWAGFDCSSCWTPIRSMPAVQLLLLACKALCRMGASVGCRPKA